MFRSSSTSAILAVTFQSSIAHYYGEYAFPGARTTIFKATHIGKGKQRVHLNHKIHVAKLRHDLDHFKRIYFGNKIITCVKML